ncbi:MAG: ferrous iron transport protein A [Veillonellaceae bacterium]|nr:ferrous iron transport protein A [Veillonellaceae bacterium]
MNLGDLRPGETATILDIRENPLRRRLQDLGLVRGTRVACVGQSPLGDPQAYRIRNTVIAIRAQDACHVQVRRSS